MGIGNDKISFLPSHFHWKSLTVESGWEMKLAQSYASLLNCFWCSFMLKSRYALSNIWLKAGPHGKGLFVLTQRVSALSLLLWINSLLLNVDYSGLDLSFFFLLALKIGNSLRMFLSLESLFWFWSYFAAWTVLEFICSACTELPIHEIREIWSWCFPTVITYFFDLSDSIYGVCSVPYSWDDELL